jgi:OPT family small oligopeptide transporter
MLGGFLVVIWFISPIMWGPSIPLHSFSDFCSSSILAKNVWFSQYMPMSVGISFDNTGAQYNLSAIITDNAFDQAKYEQYSPMFLPITYAVTYGTIFATYPAVVVHTFLWYRHDIARQFRRSLKDENDIHSHLMSKYREVPRMWFLVLGTISLVIGIIAIEICHTGLPIWAFFISIIFAVVFVVPFGIVQAITNQQFYLAVLAEIFIGYVLPGRPLAAMVFKTMGGTTVTQAVAYSSDLKLGHYMKIPPRLMFTGQVLASLVALISAIVAQQWALDNIPDICSPHQKHFFTCPNLNVFNTAAIIWGGIGPRRLFSSGAL